jgi:hypothetical protein
MSEENLIFEEIKPNYENNEEHEIVDIEKNMKELTINDTQGKSNKKIKKSPNSARRDNLKKGRERLQQLRKKKAETKEYNFNEETDSDSNSDEEIVITKRPKNKTNKSPQADDNDIIYSLQQKIKKLKHKVKPKKATTQVIINPQQYQQPPQDSAQTNELKASIFGFTRNV